MAWHSLLLCHAEHGEPGSWPFPDSCPHLRKADCSFARAEVQSRRGFASRSPGSPPPCSGTPAGPRAASPVCWGGRALLVAALERLPCQVDRTVDLGWSLSFWVLPQGQKLASGLRARPNICPLFQWALSLLHSPVPVSHMGVMAVPRPVLGARKSPRHLVRPSQDLTGRGWFLNFTDEECVTQKLRT